MANRANRRLLQRTYSARYLEVRFETIAVVGYLSQSNGTGRAFGHTKSRRLFSLLGGAERRAGILVLPPRSTFPQRHSRRHRHAGKKLPSSGIPPTGRLTSCILTPIETERRCLGLDCKLSRICSHSGHPQLCQMWSPPTRAKLG